MPVGITLFGALSFVLIQQTDSFTGSSKRGPKLWVAKKMQAVEHMYTFHSAGKMENSRVPDVTQVSSVVGLRKATPRRF